MRAALALALVLLTIPFASAEGPGVGAFVVDAAGHARGANLAASIAEATGALTGVTALGAGARVFDGFAVEGFRPTSKLAGVGSAALVLDGQAATLVLHDSLHTPLVLTAKRALTARADLGPGVEAVASADAARADLVGPAGRLGTLAVLGPGALSTTSGAVAASLHAGARLVYRGDAAGGDPAWDAAVADALADGRLGLEAATARAGSGAAAAVAAYAEGAQGTVTALPGGVAADVRGAAAVAFDFAYETLPAASADDVLVFLDGAPAPALVSASGGRVRVLLEVGDVAPHRVVVTAGGAGASDRQALVEAAARHDADVAGAFAWDGKGRLAGRHASARVDLDRGLLLDLTALRSGAALLAEAGADAGPAAASVDGARFRLAGEGATFTLADDPWITLVADADAPARVRLALAAGVAATLLSDRAAALAGPDGLRAGVAVAMRDGTTADASLLLAAGPDALVATLQPGARLVVRVEPSGLPAGPLAQALADGRLGASVALGRDGGEPAARAAALTGASEVRVDRAEEGRLELAVRGEGAVVVDARGGALAAKSARDLVVTVDGAPARRAALADVLAGDGPAWAVDVARGGAPRVVFAPGASADGDVDVVVASAPGAPDGFGTFKVFGDGTALGDFVRLRTDQAAGVLSDYTLLASGARVFTSVAAGASAFASGGGEGATRLLLENDEASLEAADVVNGWLRVAARQATTARFNLDASVEARAASDAVVALTSPGGLAGSLVLTGVDGGPTPGSGLHVEDGAVVATLQAGAQAIFRTHAGVEAELSDAQRDVLDAAVARGRVAGHVLVRTERALAADAAATSATAAAFHDDVEILTAATRESVEITVSSTSASGRTLIVSLDRETIPGMSEGLAEILLDGEPVRQASSYEDVLDATDDGGQAEYFVLAGEAGAQVLVSIPHFSTRSVTLKERSLLASPPLFMYATVFLAVLVAVETVMLARRRR